jgi:hypothetical protein
VYNREKQVSSFIFLIGENTKKQFPIEDFISLNKIYKITKNKKDSCVDACNTDRKR